MGKACSDDLWERVVEAVAAGMSRRQAAARFQVGISSAIRWVALRAETGGISPRPRGGRPRSPLAPHAVWLLELNERENDLTLAQIGQRLLDERGWMNAAWPRRRPRSAGSSSAPGSASRKNPARQRADAARRGRGSRPVEDRPAQP